MTAELGVKIDLLTYGEGKDVDIPGVRIIRIPRFGILGNIKTGPSISKLILDIFLINWTLALLIFNRYDFIHAHEESVFYCRFLKPLFNFKLIYDMHSSLPQQLVNFQFTKSRFLIHLFEKLEITCLKASDAVITICPDLANYATKMINDKNKHFLIENSIFEPVRLVDDLEDSSNRQCDQKPTEILPENREIVLYAGTLEPYQGIEILIEASRKVVSEIPDIFFLIAGGTDAQVEHYSGLAQRMGLDKNNILFTGRVSQSQVKKYISLASVVVSPRKTGTNTPLKIYELLASKVAIVATDIYSHTQVLNRNVAFLVKPESGDMSRGILQALDKNGDRDRITQNAQNLYDEKYSRQIYEKKMSQLLAYIK